MGSASPFQDFTESAYRELLALLKQRWTPAAFSRALEAESDCLWRHDIDMSPQRALRLAEIEREAEVTATYFVHLHSEFYNALEAANLEAFRGIVAAGHEIGLHLDLGALGEVEWNEALASEWLRRQAEFLAQLLDVEVKSFSIHNPTDAAWMPKTDKVAGYLNSYGPSIQARYRYCSDSNGRWRFDRLQDVLRDGPTEPIQILTHPAWWTPAAMQPRARIERCLEGRSARSLERYVATLARTGRSDAPDPAQGSPR